MRDEFDSDDSEYGSEDEDNGTFHHAGLNISELFTEDEDATHSPKVGTFLLEELSDLGEQLDLIWEEPKYKSTNIKINAGQKSAFDQLRRELSAMKEFLRENSILEKNNEDYCGPHPENRLFHLFFGDSSHLFSSIKHALGWSDEKFRNFLATGLSFAIFRETSLSAVYGRRDKEPSVRFRNNMQEYFPMTRKEYVSCWDEVRSYGYKDDGTPNKKEFLWAQVETELNNFSNVICCRI